MNDIVIRLGKKVQAVGLVPSLQARGHTRTCEQGKDTSNKHIRHMNKGCKRTNKSKEVHTDLESKIKGMNMWVWVWVWGKQARVGGGWRT